MSDLSNYFEYAQRWPEMSDQLREAVGDRKAMDKLVDMLEQRDQDLELHLKHRPTGGDVGTIYQAFDDTYTTMGSSLSKDLDLLVTTIPDTRYVWIHASMEVWGSSATWFNSSLYVRVGGAVVSPQPHDHYEVRLSTTSSDLMDFEKRLSVSFRHAVVGSPSSTTFGLRVIASASSSTVGALHPQVSVTLGQKV